MTDSPRTISKPVPELVERILAARGMTPEMMPRFLYPSYDNDLYDPYLMTGMTEAINRIVLAAENNENVVVYGDYDIDGMTASAIMIEGLAALGIAATSYIPDRFEEGYGINQTALGQIKQNGAALVISVDCGITSVVEAEYARSIGLDLIITDHHTPPEVLPQAIAVVNPKQPEDAYPFKDLCGAGVAFKVITALQQRTGKPAAGQEKWLLDLVALGTVCDVVELRDENRVLASFGLKVLRQSRRPGIAALAAVAGVTVNQLTAYHLGYVLGPRLNAAGRLEHASQALELLQTQDATRAAVIAAELDELNLRRRSEQDSAFTEATTQATTFKDDAVLVVASENWSHGIVGIVASKLVEAEHKPVLVAQILGDTTKGSARSTGSFNMVEALRANKELLIKFGGHFFAAGYTLKTNKLVGLRNGLNEYYRANTTESGVLPKPEADISISGLDDVTMATYNDLEMLEPHGAGNPAPLFSIENLRVGAVSAVGQGGKHLRLNLRDSSGLELGGIGFSMAHSNANLKRGDVVTVAGRIDINEYQGVRKLQLLISAINIENHAE